MAIQFNPNALGAFSNVDFGDDNAIANLGAENGNVVQKNTYYGKAGAIFRLGGAKSANNAVRTELLKALGRAFNLEGVGQQGGKTTFSQAFMDRLEEILGPAFKRGDFGLRNGAVDSGKPLTQRRIQAIVNAARVKGETAYDGKTYMAKVDAITGWFRNDRPQDVQSTGIGLKYFANVRKTIEFLDGGMAGFDEAGDVGDFVLQKTGMCVNVDKIKSALQESGEIKPPPKVLNIDDVVDLRNEVVQSLKREVKKLLEDLVKQSVDLMLAAKESGNTEKAEEVVGVIYSGKNHAETEEEEQAGEAAYRVEDILSGLDNLKEPHPGLEE